MRIDLQPAHQAMRKAALAYVKACGYPQTDIERLENLRDDELLYIAAGAGEDGLEYWLTMSDAKYTRATSVKIPLKQGSTKTNSLIHFAKTLDVLKREFDVTLPELAEKELCKFLATLEAKNE